MCRTYQKQSVFQRSTNNVRHPQHITKESHKQIIQRKVPSSYGTIVARTVMALTHKLNVHVNDIPKEAIYTPLFTWCLFPILLNTAINQHHATL